ncbi:RagB/SusD family nutrient uptake outer membrane protein [Polaribacter haliotis]|uniref:RagB/SusD family nutrient uptake outer membrane protein n=1 Tax=Polaribacter haliotis TaxID=1888915 RepID=A0A7L8AK22_9FLAO|nr:RagB/SusD family nutrient uptake outer membrane protein [Polaribacter haliotis]QOD62346.1 RagB/SusD family nutrient uptake outer membrane protein [Polaribacter haliotis]
MKISNYKQTVFLLLSLLFVFQSCDSDYLEAQPENNLNTDAIFQNRNQTERWWAGLFTRIPDFFNMPYGFQYSFMTDELDSSQWNLPVINSGALNPASSPSNFQQLYESIRLCSIFLQNIEGNQELQSLQNGDKIIAQYRGEATFLRAYYYWYMMRQVGPVVIVPLEPASPTDELQIPRSTWDESVEFVLTQLELAKADLPTDYFQTGTTTVDASQIGRINKMIVEAVESQILLYHASPLYNGNTTMTDFTNLDGTQLLNSNYDAGRWATAATAAKRAIDIAEANGKGLYTANGSSAFETAYNSVRNMYWDGWQTEGVWVRPSSAVTGTYEIHASPRGIAGTAYNGIAVVQKLVDDFRTASGLKIEDDPNYTEVNYEATATPYYVAGTNSMFANREARFYANVNFNGAVMPGNPKPGETAVEFYNTGNSGKAGAPRDWPKTGFSARKNVHPTFSVNPYVAVSRPAMLIRVAELYLNYAEALNESSPGNPDITNYLNRVRNRAGLPNIASGLSQSQMREEIRLERRIELCYEGAHRFSDVRRWMVAEEEGYKQGGDYFGMTMDAGNTLSSPEFHVRSKAFERASWQRKYYFLPYGQNEADRNLELVQFPGY